MTGAAGTGAAGTGAARREGSLRASVYVPRFVLQLLGVAAGVYAGVWLFGVITG